MNIEQIDKYYKSLDIKTYWSTESLSIDQINIITRTFKRLHKKYPDVIIKEIGDYYSKDKEKHEQSIATGNNLLNDKERDEKTKKIVKMLLNDIEKNKVQIFDSKYINANYSAEYYSFERQIIFNHINDGRVKENTIHEFGHAVAYQYNINNNKNIIYIFENTDKKLINKLVSTYATTEVKEFIAEAFMFYYLGRKNIIINRVMAIINDEIKNGKVMSETERLIDNAIHNYEL